MTLRQALLKTHGRRTGRMSRTDRFILKEVLPLFEIRTDGVIDPAAVFGRKAPLFVEIGFGNGGFLLQKALNNPDADFIGIEMYITGAAKLLKKLPARSPDEVNIRLFIEDSRKVLEDHFPDEGIDGVYILFPDPWPKKGQRKRRLIKPEFARLLHRKLKTKGLVVTATDHEDYAGEISDAFTTSGFLTVNADTSGIRETKYARRALSAGRTLHVASFRKSEKLNIS